MNKNTCGNSKPAVSRRAFVTGGLAAMLAALGIGAPGAKADVAGLTPDERWARAVVEAQNAGESVVPIEIEIGEVPSTLGRAARSLADITARAYGTAYIGSTLGGLVSFTAQVGGVAHFAVDTGTLVITNIYSTTLFSVSVDYTVPWVSEGQRTKIDAGRTLAIHYSFTLQNATVASTSAHSCYAEYYSDGTGNLWIS